MDNLKISVVTVCFNAVDTIEETMLSVLNQTYDNIEYIIIDGGSTDGTVDIIKKYSDKLAYWVSEPDKGIYDAMNKGIKAATGDYINFMNAGDRFYNTSVIRKFVLTEPIEDILAGIAEVHISNLRFTRFWTPARKNFKFIDIKNGMAANHQSTFTKTKILQKSGYDLKYKIISDDLFFIKAVVYEGASYRPLRLIVAKYDSDGISSSPHTKGIRDSERLQFFSLLPEDNVLNIYKLKHKRSTFFSNIRSLYFRFFNQLYPRYIIISNFLSSKRSSN